MRKNLLPKTLFIIAVLLVFVYGIFLGTDPGKAIDAWKIATFFRKHFRN